METEDPSEDGDEPQPDQPAQPPAGPGHFEELGLRLHRLERFVDPEVRLLRAAEQRALLPAWRRVTHGESRWPVTVGIAGAIAMQVALPDRVATRPRWLLPVLAGFLLIAIVATNPGRINARPEPCDP